MMHDANDANDDSDDNDELENDDDYAFAPTRRV